MKYLAVVFASLFICSVAFAEPVDGPVAAKGVLEPGHDTVIPLTLLGGDKTEIFIYAEEDDAKITCGVFTDEGDPVIVDDNGDDRCGFVVTPKSTVDVLVAVQNDGSQAAHLTLVAR